MKIKLDENLPDRLVSVLTTLGHDVDTVYAEQLTGRADPDLVGAGGRVAGLAGFPTLEPPRVDVLTPAQENAEQSDFLLRRGELMDETSILIH